MDKTRLIDDVTATLSVLLDQAQAGFMFDPEVDFASMRVAVDASQADPKLYQKTGKYIAIQRVHRPARLVIFLDINCNLRIAFQQREFSTLLHQIINTMAKDVVVEVRDENNQNRSAERQQAVSGYTHKTYRSGINDIMGYALQESQEGNIALIVSDFLDLRSGNVDLEVLRVAYLQIQLPVVSSYFHRFYIEPIKKPDVANWFVA